MNSGADYGIPDCAQSGDGPWIATYNDPFNPDVSVSSGGGGAFGAFILIALLWSLAPAVIAGVIASSRGQSVGLAILLCIFLGWIGLIIVALAFKPGVMAPLQAAVAAPAVPAPAPQAPAPRRDSASRLAELEDLKQRGLITPGEFSGRREAILKDI